MVAVIVSMVGFQSSSWPTCLLTILPTDARYHHLRSAWFILFNSPIRGQLRNKCETRCSTCLDLIGKCRTAECMSFISRYLWRLHHVPTKHFSFSAWLPPARWFGDDTYTHSRSPRQNVRKAVLAFLKMHVLYEQSTESLRLFNQPPPNKFRLLSLVKGKTCW